MSRFEGSTDPKSTVGCENARCYAGSRAAQGSLWSIPDISSSLYALSVVVRTLPREPISRRWALRASSPAPEGTLLVSEYEREERSLKIAVLTSGGSPPG